MTTLIPEARCHIMKTRVLRLSRRPPRALAIWFIDACAIVVLSLVMLAVNEFRHQPGDAATK